MRYVLAACLSLATVSGCIDSGAVECSGGFLCPPGTACATRNRCADPDDVAACAMQDHGDPCSSAQSLDGVCDEGVCILARCGNDVIETYHDDEDDHEACDDGNQLDGDGCSADCKSNEECGNGFLDERLGEDCDDGNTLDRDACNHDCVQSSLWWRGVFYNKAEGVRHHAMAYDARRDRVVMFGGLRENGERSAETWEWTGHAWRLLTPPSGSPSPRSHHAMAYDARRGVVVLFGGNVSEEAQGASDTWEWDGTQWRERQLASSPPASTDHAMTYDPVRGEMVLYTAVGTLASETWTYDGSTWTAQEPPEPTPPTRSAARMVFNPHRGRVTLVGGFTGLTEPLNRLDIWEWDGTQWTEQQPTGAPSEVPRYFAIGYDIPNKRVVIQGGTMNTGLSNDQWWAWTPSSNDWKALAPGDGADLTDHAMAPLGDGRLMLFGGKGAGVVQTDEVVVYDPFLVDWQVLEPKAPDHVAWSGGEHGFPMGGMAYDPARGTAIMTTATPGLALSTWEWDGTRWSNATPAPAVGDPAARVETALAYDAARGRIVMFGGRDLGDNYLNDTFEWDGSRWVELPAAEVPPARARHGMVYDRARDRLVVFGGCSAGLCAEQLGDTWEYDGTTWTQVSTTGPSPRYSHGMAYDIEREVTLMAGGAPATAGNELNDVWEWNGQEWMLVSGTESPPMKGHAMVYDPALRGIVTVGGFSHSTRRNTVHAWIPGTAQGHWLLRDVASGPNAMPPRAHHVAVYDRARGGVLVVGGNTFTSGVAEDVWLFEYRVDGLRELCLEPSDGDLDGDVGCDDGDCWGVCRPLTLPGAADDASQPHCGDSDCQPPREDFRNCPADCPPTAELCGDFLCVGGENNTDCPGDCP